MGLFGPEKMILKLENINFFPGEKIKGTVSINLKKPLQARKLQVGLYGVRKERYRGSDGKTQTKTTTVYDFVIPLGQEGEYQKGDYSFEIPIPNDILMIGTRQRQEGKLGAIADIANALGGQSYYPVEWLVKSNLDLAMKFDVSKEQKIVIA
jgi:hypothetical protein